MILEINQHSQILYLDKDEEEFQFYTKHYSIEDYNAHWRKSLTQLNEHAVPVLLPTYIEYEEDVIDVQGYVLYPYKTAWVMIDSGVRMPSNEEITMSYKHIAPIDEELPIVEREWQSHWWITGKDLDSLCHDLDIELSFKNGTLPVEPLVSARRGDEIDIYADRQCFSLNFSTFKNKEDVRSYARMQIMNFTEGNNSQAIVPAFVVDGEMLLYSFFLDGEYAYLAQFSLECQNGVCDFDAIEARLKATNYKPYVVKEDPVVFALHARYTSNTAVELLQIL